jgi:hypothetical protein
MTVKATAILSIVVFLCLSAVVALQVLEFSSYRADPSVWPVAVK